MLLYKVGTAHEVMGDRIAALRYLTRSVREGIPVELINETLELADLIEDPRFVRMVTAAAGQEDSQADVNR